MNINSFKNIGQLGSNIPQLNFSTPDIKLSFESDKSENKSFSNVFTQALDGVNNTLLESGDLARKVASGEVQNIHDVAIAGVKAETTLKLTTHVISKLTSAATTIFQMQI